MSTISCKACDAGLPLGWSVQSRKTMHLRGLELIACAHIDACDQEAREMDAEIETRALGCPHCQAHEPSVWDGVLSHYAHPAGTKLKYCHKPWRDRCRRCSADMVPLAGAMCCARLCGVAERED